ncbi:tetratricopeptide repeat protein [Hymenobacter coccineus]|uniref:Tetratricopeptide repeat protein n=1 Tax=Hymenobacter coccineus TaxID=1908235 RepID=A0A1G1TMI0_9BACT|nr:tetratricopeptide repeat protein [Hymenobacter coccineus]OGX92076.1 hypothetical protein BEN49_17320 [Hymenobacter coccineus]
MKKVLSTLAVAAALAATAPHAAQAQNSAVTNALLNQKTGLLDKARTDIDKAVLDPKTSGKAKTWYTRGDIYAQMMSSPIYSKQLQPGEGLQKASESFNKTIELDTNTGEYGKLAGPQLQNLYGQAFNAGVEAYNAKDYDKAITNYQLASKLNPTDTTAVLYSAYAQDAKQDYTGAKATYNQLIGMDAYKAKPAPVQVYNRLLQIARQDKNEAEATKVLQQALAAYPNNKNFMLEELNVYLTTGRGNEAIEKINKAIAADPSNASNLYAVLGGVYDRNKQPVEASAAYQKAIAADPNNFDAQYNLGVNNYNKAAEAYTKASKMDLKTYQVSGKKYEVQGKKYFEESVPYFEKALQIKPDDTAVMQTLQKVYFRLGRTADSERLSAKLKK